ncbi:MAG TPA: hypothetical protein VGQ42_17675 [Candidatus Dormibacteraeota bacterium]|jgi:hypothetical protein|nr:hypothetical protein [Candidatus Dormibacteraeota bacterium]
MSFEEVPKAAQVYERLGAGIGPVLEALGMRRVSRLSYPAWVLREVPEGLNVFLSLQTHAKAKDTFAGGRFRVELEKSSSGRPAGGLGGRAMFFQLLTSAELQTLLEQQNTVITGLPRPPQSHVDGYPATLRDHYLSWFEPQSKFTAIDAWMRYRSLSDLDAWAAILVPLMPVLIERATTYLDGTTLQLGSHSLLGARQGQDRP